LLVSELSAELEVLDDVLDVVLEVLLVESVETVDMIPPIVQATMSSARRE
jgi:hypothetical protein